MEDGDQVVSDSRLGLLHSESEQGTSFVFNTFYGIGISDKGSSAPFCCHCFIYTGILHPLRVVQGDRL